MAKFTKYWRKTMPGDRYETHFSVGQDCPEELYPEALNDGVVQTPTEVSEAAELVISRAQVAVDNAENKVNAANEELRVAMEGLDDAVAQAQLAEAAAEATGDPDPDPDPENGGKKSRGRKTKAN